MSERKAILTGGCQCGVLRDFCADCGTPLSYRPSDGDVIELLAGTLDDPSAVTPADEVGTENKLPWVATLHKLPGKTSSENMGAEAETTLKSFQYRGNKT